MPSFDSNEELIAMLLTSSSPKEFPFSMMDFSIYTIFFLTNYRQTCDKTFWKKLFPLLKSKKSSTQFCKRQYKVKSQPRVTTRSRATKKNSLEKTSQRDCWSLILIHKITSSGLSRAGNTCQTKKREPERNDRKERVYYITRIIFMETNCGMYEKLEIIMQLERNQT